MRKKPVSGIISVRQETEEKKVMKRVLYFECNSGISGDMTVAALLDLGADRAALQRALESIPAGGFHTEIGRVKKSAVDCCDFRVILDEAHENHDHDTKYLYPVKMSGEVHSHDDFGHHAQEDCGDVQHKYDHCVQEHDGHMHHHGYDAGTDGQSEHGHAHHGHHAHRSFKEVKEILAGVDMSERAHAIALKIFTIIAEAEAKAHNTSVEEVHFHEVGAIDSIVDITAAAVCFDSLHIEDVIIPYLAEGWGSVRCQHGLLPVPVPAVVNITRAYRLPLRMTGIEGEYVTPTGAAIAAALRTSSALPDSYTIERVGLGAGKRDTVLAGFLRVMILECEEQSEDTVWKLETDIDDSTGEQLGYCMNRLFEAGALDVHYVPVFMKKNRPGVLLVAICSEKKREAIENIIFEETTTIGIRRFPVERTCLTRKILEIGTPLGNAKVKAVSVRGRDRFYPEYETAAELARKHDRPLAEVYHLIEEAAGKLNCRTDG